MEHMLYICLENNTWELLSLECWMDGCGVCVCELSM